MGLVDEFLSWWRERYPASPPVGHALRVAYRERWLRVHSLPAARRFPDDESDWAELLRRHAAIGTHVLGNEPCFVAIGGWAPPDVAALAPDDALARHASGLAFDAVDAPLALADADIDWLAVALTTWDPVRVERLLRARANDEIGPVAFVAKSTADVYAPYPGGADLFLEPVRRDAARQRFVTWLSPNADSL